MNFKIKKLNILDIGIEDEMDSNIPFIIKNVPYLWLDKNPSFGGVKGWDQTRFSRIYLVPPGQTLYQGYLFPAARCPKIAEYFRGQTHSIGPKNYHDIRLNGARVNLEHGDPAKPYRCSICDRIATWRCQAEHGADPPERLSGRSDLPISVLYRALKLSFRPLSINNLQTITPKPPVLIAPKVDKLKLMFPPGIDDYKLIKMTDVGVYSVTYWNTTRAIVFQMNRYIIPQDIKGLTITDATAGVGGDTLCFARRFERVNAVELAPLHCLTISHNLSVYAKRGNVRLICANYVDVVGLYTPWPGKPVAQNVIYFDPPWGGRHYKDRDTIVLKLDNVPLSQIIAHIIRNRLADYIFVKAPRNANLDGFPLFKWVRIRNFQLICIKSKWPREKHGLRPD